MYELLAATPAAWVEAVLAGFDRFLQDHAAAEKKAAGMAISMVSHYPDQTDLVEAMLELALEEMAHFREVTKLLHSRGLTLTADGKDPYVNRLRQAMRTGSREYLLDRLLVGSIVERRGCERFGLVAEALPEGKLRRFYAAITASEARHGDLFLEIAQRRYPEAEIAARAWELAELEAAVMLDLPIRPALH